MRPGSVPVTAEGPPRPGLAVLGPVGPSLTRALSQDLRPTCHAVVFAGSLEASPWRGRGCSRGNWGHPPVPHSSGSPRARGCSYSFRARVWGRSCGLLSITHTPARKETGCSRQPGTAPPLAGAPSLPHACAPPHGGPRAPSDCLYDPLSAPGRPGRNASRPRTRTAKERGPVTSVWPRESMVPTQDSDRG